MVKIYFSLLWTLFMNGVESSEKNYFVSLNGSDDWDGTSAENNPGTDTGPWLTIDHAIQKLRTIRPSQPGLADTTTLNILAGTYYQASTIYLDARDSYLNIAAYNNDKVSISGGFPLDLNWHKQGDVFSSQFIGSCAEAFHGSQRLLPARSPNTDWGWNRNVAQGPYNVITDLLVDTESCQRDSLAYSQSCPEEDRNGFVFTDEISEDWDFVDQTEILIFHSWIAEYVKIANISHRNGRNEVMFQHPLKHAPIGNFAGSSGWRFLIFNNLALLDIPGEYVCLEEDGTVQFSYIAPEETEEGHPIMSKLEIIMQIRNSRHINIQGVKFEHTSSGGNDGYNYGNQAAVKIINTDDVIIEDCEFSHTGMIGLYLKNSSRVSIQNNVFFDLGYNGVMLQFTNEDHIMDDVLIKNNYFDGCGISRFWQPACVYVGGSNNISVVNNEITNTPYMGMAVRGLMLHGDKYWSDNGVIDPSREDYVFHVEFNYIHDFGNAILSDFGAVYIGVHNVSCDSLVEEDMRKFCYTYIHVYNNLIHDSRAFNNDANFLYSDSSSCRNTFENNIMYGAGLTPLYHHCGLDNVSKNNIIHKTAGEDSVDHLWAGCEKSHTGRLQGYTNYKNIYFLDSADGLECGRRWDRFYNNAPTFYNNLYWSQQVGDEIQPMFPDQMTWDEWVLAGNDSFSVWADPLFLDPASGQYLLRENSPAWDLGIEQIRLDNFGILSKKQQFKTKHALCTKQGKN